MRQEATIQEHQCVESPLSVVGKLAYPHIVENNDLISSSEQSG